MHYALQMAALRCQRHTAWAAIQDHPVLIPTEAVRDQWRALSTRILLFIRTIRLWRTHTRLCIRGMCSGARGVRAWSCTTSPLTAFPTLIVWHTASACIRALQDIFYLEVCLYDQICNNRGDLWVLEAGDPFECDVEWDAFLQLREWIISED